jgi:alkanesulfonate monooxygenase SsuD/methylene tetrahydromethanopterin reductase-like flavin-dependent oxidoreductase (luciferase family)
MGAGWFELEHRQNGFPFPDVSARLDRFAEYVEIVVRSWTEESVDHRGKHFTLESQRARPFPIQKPHPPVIVGGQAKQRSLRLAAAFAQEYNVAFLPPAEVAGVRRRIDQACIDAGRDPATLSLSLMTLVALGHDEAAAAARLTRGLQQFRGPRERCEAGTVQQMADVLRGYEAAGVSRVFLQHPDREDFEAIELIGALARAVA